jgi:hypothetical protein
MVALLPPAVFSLRQCRCCIRISKGSSLLLYHVMRVRPRLSKIYLRGPVNGAITSETIRNRGAFVMKRHSAACVLKAISKCDLVLAPYTQRQDGTCNERSARSVPSVARCWMAVRDAMWHSVKLVVCAGTAT